jgi:hypothetical protein
LFLFVYLKGFWGDGNGGSLWIDVKTIEIHKAGEPDKSGETMKPKAIYVGFLCSMMFVFWNLARQNDWPALQGGYLDQRPPGLTPLRLERIIYSSSA